MQKKEKAPIGIRAKLKYADRQTFIERYAPNVSAGGMFLQNRAPQPVGTRINFEIMLATGETLLKGEGTVLWVKEYNAAQPQRAHGMGIKFLKIDEASKKLHAEILQFKKQLAAAKAGEKSPEADEEAPSEVSKSNAEAVFPTTASMPGINEVKTVTGSFSIKVTEGSDSSASEITTAPSKTTPTSSREMSDISHAALNLVANANYQEGLNIALQTAEEVFKELLAESKITEEQIALTMLNLKNAALSPSFVAELAELEQFLEEHRRAAPLQPISLSLPPAPKFSTRPVRAFAGPKPIVHSRPATAEEPKKINLPNLISPPLESSSPEHTLSSILHQAGMERTSDLAKLNGQDQLLQAAASAALALDEQSAPKHDFDISDDSNLVSAPSLPVFDPNNRLLLAQQPIPSKNEDLLETPLVAIAPYLAPEDVSDNDLTKPVAGLAQPLTDTFEQPDQSLRATLVQDESVEHLDDEELAELLEEESEESLAKAVWQEAALKESGPEPDQAQLAEDLLATVEHMRPASINEPPAPELDLSAPPPLVEDQDLQIARLPEEASEKTDVAPGPQFDDTSAEGEHDELAQALDGLRDFWPKEINESEPPLKLPSSEAGPIAAPEIGAENEFDVAPTPVLAIDEPATEAMSALPNFGEEEPPSDYEEEAHIGKARKATASETDNQAPAPSTEAEAQALETEAQAEAEAAGLEQVKGKKSGLFRRLFGKKDKG